MDEIIKRLRRLSLNLKSNREVLGLEQFDKDIDEIEATSKIYEKSLDKACEELRFMFSDSLDDRSNYSVEEWKEWCLEDVE